MNAVASKVVSMPAGLFAVDQLLRKWGAADARDCGFSRTMHVLERIRLLGEGTVFSPPAPELQEFAIVDAILATSPNDTRAFIVLWYCEPGRTVGQKADVMNISRAQAYNDLRYHLAYMKGRLNDRGVRM